MALWSYASENEISVNVLLEFMAILFALTANNCSRMYVHGVATVIIVLTY